MSPVEVASEAVSESKESTPGDRGGRGGGIPSALYFLLCSSILRLMDADKVLEEAVVLAGVMATDVVVDDVVEVDDTAGARVTDVVSVVDVEDVALTSPVAVASPLF